MPTPGERRAWGKSLRASAPRSGHADWAADRDGVDPVGLIDSQNADRLPWLVPIRHARMAESPFAYFRGAAIVMAADLASTPASGITAQLCGDAHLSNFGSFASPERQQVFDVNDFDETLPGPWEWDVKRLASSVVLAARENGLKERHARDAAAAACAAYRRAMARFAEMKTLDLWYSQLPIGEIADALPDEKGRARLAKRARKWRTKNSARALGKLAERTPQGLRIRNDPPLLLSLRRLARTDATALEDHVRAGLDGYAATLAPNRRSLLQKYELVDLALKVVGVGSVGTRCLIGLFLGRDDDDPLFLQIKEATSSVLEAHLASASQPHAGQRVVEGQRLMQAASDIFLGWSSGEGGRRFYWRQLHDMKGSAEVERMNADRLRGYSGLCGWTLAHAHARSGDPIAIAGYLGKSERFDGAITEFAASYADQTARDYDAFIAAIRAGEIEASEE